MISRREAETDGGSLSAPGGFEFFWVVMVAWSRDGRWAEFEMCKIKLKNISSSSIKKYRCKNSSKFG